MLALYENIKNRRTELKITQDELAEKLGYKGKSMICKIEKGLVDLPQSKIRAFAKALETTPARLMGWDEEKERTARESVDAAEVSLKLRDDPEMVQALKIYFSLPPDKKRHVIDSIRILK